MSDWAVREQRLLFTLCSRICATLVNSLYAGNYVTILTHIFSH